MKRFFSLLVLALLLTGLPGCWDLKELNETGLVLLIGIDTNPKGDGFEITAHVNAPVAPGGAQGDGQSGSQTVAVFSAQGQTVMDAFRNLRGRIPFRLTFHHVRLLIIGEDLARKGIKPVLDFMLRTTEIRLNSRIMVSQGPAKDFLRIPPEGAETLSEELQGLLNNEDIWSKTQSVTILNFAQDFIDPGRHPIATKVFALTPEVSDPIMDEEKLGEKTAKGKIVFIEGVAVFNDDQMQGWLSGTETIGYRYIAGEGSQIILVVPWHAAKAALQVNLDSCQKTFVGSSYEPVIKIDIKVTAEVVEYTGKINLSDKKVLQELESLAAAQFADMLRATDNRAKEMGVDFLGYGAMISRTNPKAWSGLNKEWRETFPTVKTEFDVRFSLQNVGYITSPLQQ